MKRIRGTPHPIGEIISRDAIYTVGEIIDMDNEEFNQRFHEQVSESIRKHELLTRGFKTPPNEGDISMPDQCR